ncbi:MAG: GNAT family N-acetyltransferase [Candidatus Thorarchaeota archaeon]|jgi:RimJ/RimL family protein N-acetyltransferase
MYEGEKVKLRRLEPEDSASILTYWNQYELRQYLPTPLPTSQDDMLRYIESVNEAFSKRSKFTFGIETKDDSTLIGIIDLTNISWMSSNGEIGIFAIFHPNYRGKGLGKDALVVLLDIAFSVLNMHTVYLWVASFNDRAIGFYERIGFKTQGKLREMAYRDGQRYDVVIMDILKTEFLEKYGVLPKK